MEHPVETHESLDLSELGSATSEPRATATEARPEPGRGKTVVLLGANFTTGNLGVSALAWSSIRLIRTRWPEAEVIALGGSRTASQHTIYLDGEPLTVRGLPVRYSRNVFQRDHILGILVVSQLQRLFPFLQTARSDSDTTLGAFRGAEAFFDMTGGDSFSDIYGVTRFLRNYLLKRACQSRRRPYIMLPQTYGPFRHALTRLLARDVIKHADRLLARDQESPEHIERIAPGYGRGRCEVCPDVAFILEPREKKTPTVDRIRDRIAQGERWVGINISGLLYANGYTGQNEFGLLSDYRSLVESIVTRFASTEGCRVLLVPHVVTPDAKGRAEDDLQASEALRRSLPSDLAGRVLIANDADDPCYAKYLIGQCDFFIGSRMHATIGALSQRIPTAGLAYSGKFAGVYRTIEMGDCVIDLRTMEADVVIDRVLDLYDRRAELRDRLEVTIPRAQDQVHRLLNDVDL